MLKHLLTTTTALGLLLSPALCAQTAPGKVNAAGTTKKEAESKAQKPGYTPGDNKPGEKKPGEKKSAEKRGGDPSDPEQALISRAEKESATLTDAQSKKLLELVNTGEDKAVQEIPGVGEVRSKAIMKARPLKSVAALIMVEGIGEGTFDEIVKWAKDGMKTEATAEKPAAKPAEKPTAKEKEAPKKPAKETPPAKPGEKAASVKKPA